MTELDMDKLHATGKPKMLGDLGGAFCIPCTHIGLRLGLFDALDQGGGDGGLPKQAPVSPKPYVQEWVLAQAANGFVTFEPETARFHLSPEQAMVFAIKDSPVYLAGALDLAAAMIEGEPKVEAAFRDGSGVRWGDSAGCLFCSVGAFFRPTYANAIGQERLPALDGVDAKLKAGAKVADIGCGVGFSTLLMADAYPESSFVGFDFHEESIAEARSHATGHGSGARGRFETAAAKEIAEGGFDLITAFDCLHDMGDPKGCATHMREILKPDGTWMIVEPMAGDRPEDNMNPVGRLHYNASTMICRPAKRELPR
ncbi:MAG: class I SAM-dependent methyltransferase [Alphaproteobacteria bacterium]